MKKSRLTLGNFINNMSFQRAQGKIDTFYPHCYSLVLLNDVDGLVGSFCIRHCRSVSKTKGKLLGAIFTSSPDPNIRPGQHRYHSHQ